MNFRRLTKGCLPGRLQRAGALAAVSAAAASLAACGGSPSAAASGGNVLQVVVAENDWGSIAAQVGGKYASARSSG